MELSRREFLIATASVAVACGDDIELPEDMEPRLRHSTLEITSGRFLTGRPGDTLGPLTVRVLDKDGEPLDGANVLFQIMAEPQRTAVGMTGGEATIDASTVTTGPDGTASVTAVLAEKAGRVTVECRLADYAIAEGRPIPVRFFLWSVPPEQGSKRPITLLSFCDFHVHLEPWGPTWRLVGGLARLATLLKDLRAANDAAGVPTLVFNSGDDFENTLYQNEPGAFEALMQTWDRVGVNFWQTGNHDFHFGVPFLADKILAVRDQFADNGKGHPMFVTWGNVDSSTLYEHVADYADLFENNFDDPDNERLFQQTVVHDIGGIRVGVIGAVTDAAVFTHVPGDPVFFQILGAQSPEAQGLTFLDPDPRESSYIADAIDNVVAQGANIVLVASHTGLGMGDRVNLPPGKDEHIARNGVGGESGRAVDVILGGHSHLRLNHAGFLDNPAGGKTGLTQACEGGVYVARVDLMVDTDNNTVEWVDSGLILVDDTLDEDPDTAAVVAELAAALDARHPDRKTAVAQVDTFLSSREKTVCGLGNVINAAFLHSLDKLENDGKVFTSMVVPSTYRTDVNPGPIDPDLAYQILSMHKMDTEGLNNDTIAYITFRPGRFNASLLNINGTQIANTTLVEYAVELVHSFQDALAEVVPMVSEELKLEVIQLGRVSYQVDVTAPTFSRVIPESVLVDGERPDPAKTYCLAGPHSIILVLGRVLDTFLVANPADEDTVAGSPVLADETTGEPFTDTEIPLWVSLSEYLAETFGGDQSIPESMTAMMGDSYRTVQPDLTINPTDITVDPQSAFPGEGVQITVKLRNLGETAVDSARVALYFDTMPWDATTSPDGYEDIEGFETPFSGSHELISATTASIGAYPATEDVSFEWTIPEGTPVGPIPIEVRISDVVSSVVDDNTGDGSVESCADNNAGRQRARLLGIR